MMLRSLPHCQAPSRCSGTRRSAAASTHLRRARKSQAPEPERASTAQPSSTPAPAAPPAAAAAPESDPGPRITREWTSLGSKVIESNQGFDGPENQKDFWEGENFEGFGKLVERYFLPSLVVLGLICGGIAARSYNEGADGYIKPPGSPDDEAAIIVAVPQGTPDSNSMVVAPDSSL